MFVRNARSRGSRGRSPGPEQQIDLVVRDQLFVEFGRGRRIAAVVIDDQFHLPAKQPAAGVDLVAPEFDARKIQFGRVRKVPALRERDADPQGFVLRLGAERNEECGHGHDSQVEPELGDHVDAPGSFGFKALEVPGSWVSALFLG